ncbi:MAG: hypothetical protein ACYTHJ_11470 [Planctomycetota bacterium]|jgi:hypothetical protein
MQLVKTGMVILAWVPALAAEAVAGSSSPTAFTYQGQLKYDGVPVTDNCDIEMALYDSESGGNPLATQTFYKIEIVNGLFTVQPDFGDGFLDGPPRYLEITVAARAKSP